MIFRVARPMMNYQHARNMSMVATAKNIGDNVQTNVRKLIASGYLNELRPPMPWEIPTAVRDLTRLFTKSNWREVTFRDAWLNTLVTTEVLCWFFVGECIGKGTLIGYQV